MNPEKDTIAIVIPAYKGEFLKKTLESLIKQNNKDFNVYVGNDNSPDRIEDVIEDYYSKLNLVYKKFDNNLGSISLVKHWVRCISLIRNENWIWILGDDDYLSANCVSLLFDAIKKNKNSDVFRFASIVVDQHDRWVTGVYNHPTLESGSDFLIRKYQKVTRSSCSEYVFSRKIYDQKGIVDFPLAWYSDDLMWYRFSNEQPIMSINEGIVYVRISGSNISNNKDIETEAKKQSALKMYTQWVRSNSLLLNNRIIANYLAKKYFLGLCRIRAYTKLFSTEGVILFSKATLRTKIVCLKMVLVSFLKRVEF